MLRAKGVIKQEENYEREFLLQNWSFKNNVFSDAQGLHQHLQQTISATIKLRMQSLPQKVQILGYFTEKFARFLYG